MKRVSIENITLCYQCPTCGNKATQPLADVATVGPLICQGSEQGCEGDDMELLPDCIVTD